MSANTQVGGTPFDEPVSRVILDQKKNLLGMDLSQLKNWLSEHQIPAFRAKQVFKWIHAKNEADFSAMTDLSQKFRHWLEKHALIDPPRLVSEKISQDGTIKCLFDVGGHNLIETVYIPEKARGTLCVSSQVGCALACAFCATGKHGFNRNLSSSEIIGQVWQVTRCLNEKQDGKFNHISNVVFMGMGEPLANVEHLLVSLNVLLDDHAYGLSRRRVTVSTAGLVPGIDRLAQELKPVALAVSLHASEDHLRDELVPINKKYPLDELIAACRRYLKSAPRDFITFEYTMLGGVNDTDEYARLLYELSQKIPCKINLIPYNRVSGLPFQVSDSDRIDFFYEFLNSKGVVTTVRKTRGDKIAAACGQLAGRFQDKTRRTRRVITDSKSGFQGE